MTYNLGRREYIFNKLGQKYISLIKSKAKNDLKFLNRESTKDCGTDK
jgi:hypothetical protein